MLLIIVSTTLTSCSAIGRLTEPKEVRDAWGDKELIINFLNSPQAKATRWHIEAMGK